VESRPPGRRGYTRRGKFGKPRNRVMQSHLVGWQRAIIALSHLYE